MCACVPLFVHLTHTHLSPTPNPNPHSHATGSRNGAREWIEAATAGSARYVYACMFMCVCLSPSLSSLLIQTNPLSSKHTITYTLYPHTHTHTHTHTLPSEQTLELWIWLP